MIKDFSGEQWAAIKFDFEFTNDCRIEISNFGRIRTFNKVSNGNIINGSMINGYRIIRLKLYEPRDEKLQQKFDYLQQQVFKLSRTLKALKDNNASHEKIAETTELLTNLKKKLTKKFQADLKKRTINYQALVHRLVAEYFLKKTNAEETIVAHTDHNKLNNNVTNLKWMTPEENYIHQQHSPYVLKEKQERLHRRKEKSKATKLTVTKVMLLKKC